MSGDNEIKILGLPETLTLEILEEPGRGTLICQNNLKIPVTIEDPDEHGWMIKLFDESAPGKELFELLCTGVEPLQNLIKVASFQEIISEMITFKKFEIQFDRTKSGPTWIDLNIKLGKPWKVGGKLIIEHSSSVKTTTHP